MKKQGLNPYLPATEYVPDAEPHVFGDRVYIYGSHDKFGAPFFCVGDYVCYSASVQDLTEWRYEGVIYRRNQDSANVTGLRCLFAPDVAQGPDGRYYLYYAYDFMGQMGVAVCDEPAGEYEFLGHISYPDGHYWGSRNGEPFPFDPGVLVDDDGRVWLYSGFATKVPAIASRGHKLTNPGCVVLELEPDMLTIRSGPKVILPLEGDPGAFAGHHFFEASSIRKINGRYYFVYSSENNHDLCYATADSPTGPFTYGGVLVDIGDVGLPGISGEMHASNYLGNTHGGLLKLGDDWYIFYHRQTNRNSYARQACAEKLTVTKDGRLLQAEVTSCGLNGGSLPGYGRYEARIACNLWSKQGTGRYDAGFPRFRFRKHPYFTENTGKYKEEVTQYIANMRHGAVAGFKYFAMEGPGRISVTLGRTKSHDKGVIYVSADPNFRSILAKIKLEERPVRSSKNMATYRAKMKPITGDVPLYFMYRGPGSVDFIEFELYK